MQFCRHRGMLGLDFGCPVYPTGVWYGVMFSSCYKINKHRPLAKIFFSKRTENFRPVRLKFGYLHWCASRIQSISQTSKTDFPLEKGARGFLSFCDLWDEAYGSCVCPEDGRMTFGRLEIPLTPFSRGKSMFGDLKWTSFLIVQVENFRPVRLKKGQ